MGQEEIVNYAELLSLRARHALKRRVQEEIATTLQMRNAECLKAWRVKWAMDLTYPDTVPPNIRRLIDTWFQYRRRMARESMRIQKPVRLLRLVKK